METKHIRLIFTLFCFFLYGQIQAGTDYQRFQHSSGLYVLQHIETTQSSSIQLYFRIGTTFETDSFLGYSLLFSEMIYRKLLLNASGLNINQIVEPEMMGFTFNVEQDKIASTLALIQDVVFNLSITEADLTALQQEHSAAPHEPYSGIVLQRLWGKDYNKVNSFSNHIPTAIGVSALHAFYKKYFAASNAVLCINSGLDKTQINELLEKNFTRKGIVQFNPERITHVLEFKPIVNNTHLILKSSTEKEEVGIVFQNPGARYDRRGSYCAYLMNQILENEGKANHLNATYKSNNYFGTFSLTQKVVGHNYKTSLDQLTTVVGKIKRMELITPDKLSKAKDLVINEYKNLALSGPVFFMKEIAFYRFTNDENYILSFADSLANISEQDMQWYINDYFINRAGVMYTLANSNPELVSDSSQRVYNLDGDFSTLKCVYELNKTDLCGDTNWANVYRVIRWLQINTDAHVQINGFADEGEYNRVKDVALQTFIDSIPTFKKAMPDFIKTGYMRPESMRSLKLMKVFYENGIDLNRITGTSMLYTSDSKEKAAENRKCSFVVEKIKPTISLREYHYNAKN